MTEAIKRVVSDMRREAALWPKTERAQQTARLLNGFADELEAALAAAPASSPQLYPPHADCPTCHGTGESPNAQFRCHCRWHRIGCALVQGRGDCDCRRV